MAKCLFCERKSIFLRVNAEGYCKDCVPRVAARRRDEEEKKREEAERIAENRRLEEERRRIEEERRKRTDEYGHEVGILYTFVPVTVAGVTFKNGRRSRQTILREIYWKDDPYKRIDPNKIVELEATTYNGEPAVEVWVHHKQTREQIGYIPREDAAFFSENMYRYASSYGFEVYGGGTTSDGERLSFGCSFTARFFNKAGQGEIDESLYNAMLYYKQLESSTPPDSGHYAAYQAFRRQYKEANVIGVSPMSGSDDGIIVHLSADTEIHVNRTDDSYSFAICNNRD